MLVDAHTHLDRYGAELDEAIAEIERYRILTICTSMNIPSYLRNLEIARRSAFILPIFGVHPWNAEGYTDRLEELKPHIEQSPMLGEVGLDYHFVKESRRYPGQRRVLEVFLQAAREQGKVLNLHTKGAEKDILDQLDRYQLTRVIIHWYSGPLDILDEMISRGYYFTIGVECAHSEAIRTITRRIPTDQLLSETDNPGAVEWLEGKLGMPSAARDVVRCLASLKGITRDDAVGAVGANLRRLLADDPWIPVRFRDLLDERQTDHDADSY